MSLVVDQENICRVSAEGLLGGGLILWVRLKIVTGSRYLEGFVETEAKQVWCLEYNL